MTSLLRISSWSGGDSSGRQQSSSASARSSSASTMSEQVLEDVVPQLAFRDPQALLWNVLEGDVPVSERAEVRRAIGAKLLAENESLFEELAALLDILAGFREEVDLQRERKRNSRSFLNTRGPVQQYLRHEIKILVQNFQKKGKPVEQVLRPETPRQQAVLEFVLSDEAPSKSPPSRPSTARPRSARPDSAPALSGTERDTPRAATSHSQRETLADLRDHLTVDKIQQAVNTLRVAFEDERRTLMEDIEFVQECIEKEIEFRDRVEADEDAEPTLQEMRELESTLQSKWEEAQQREFVERLPAVSNRRIDAVAAVAPPLARATRPPVPDDRVAESPSPPQSPPAAIHGAGASASAPKPPGTPPPPHSTSRRPSRSPQRKPTPPLATVDAPVPKQRPGSVHRLRRLVEEYREDGL